MEIVVLTNAQLDELADRISLKVKEELMASFTPSIQSDEVMDNKAFISYCKISLRMAQKLRDEGNITFTRIGRKIVYKKSDVDAFLKCNRIELYNTL